MKYLVIGDLHIGSPYFQREAFLEVLERLRPEVDLVLAGDVVDDPFQHLGEKDQQVVDRLRRESVHRRVVWINGNHDDGFRPEPSARLVFTQSFPIDTNLLVTHGADFDGVMPRNRWFLRLFRILHGLRIFFGAHPVHVATYAKRWKRLYRFLRKNVMLNAVQRAKELGFSAVACGHVHFAEDRSVEGIRYLNLGAWLESPLFCLLVDGSRMLFLSRSEALNRITWFCGAQERPVILS